MRFTTVTILSAFAAWSTVLHVISFSNFETFLFFRVILLQVRNTRAKNVAFETLFCSNEQSKSHKENTVLWVHVLMRNSYGFYSTTYIILVHYMRCIKLCFAYV